MWLLKKKAKKTLSTYRSMWNSTSLISFGDLEDAKEIKNEAKSDERINKKPIEIWEELCLEQPNIDCSDIQNRIRCVEERIKVLSANTREPLTDEYETLGYLKARKNYPKNKDQFRWPITTDKIIKNLCSKYKVQIVSLDQYYTLIPEEGIKEIQQYREACNKVRTDKPVFRLIVPANPPKEIEQRKRDPILLASSPFGRWDFILGAWDKEVAIVDDFIYNGK